MKVTTKKPSTKYKNFIQEWYENHTLIPTPKKDICKYEKGMMIHSPDIAALLQRYSADSTSIGQKTL